MRDGPTQAMQLLELLALCGELPVAAINRLPMTENYRYKVVASLKSKKLIRLYSRDSVKAYRLTAAGKSALIQMRPERYRNYFEEAYEQNRTELPRRLRLHTTAHSFITMQNAGISLYQDSKPSLFGTEVQALHNKPDRAVYYFPREIKNIGLESNKIRSSRTCGILFDSSRIYLTYNTGNSIMKWEYQTELRLRSIITARFSLNPVQTWYKEEEIVGLMLGDNMEIALQILKSGGGYRHNGFRPNVSFEQFWFCPNNLEGETQLQIQTSSAYTQIKQLLLSDLTPKTQEVSMELDAWDTDGRPVLLALNFDMPRLKKFHDYLELFGKTGQLYCYDFQAPVLEEYMQNLAKVCSVSLQKITRRFLYK